MKTLTLLLAATLGLSVSGCSCHSTGANEVGVLTRKVAPFVGKKGVQHDPYPPGDTCFFVFGTTDWHRFETKLQNLRIVKESTDDVEFKTVDGNDISVDVTVAWRVDPAKAACLLMKVGESTRDIEDRVVRPGAPGFVLGIPLNLGSIGPIVACG